MSIEIHVLFAGKLPSTAALTQSFGELGFPLAFSSGADELEQHKGYLPMTLCGEKPVSNSTHTTNGVISKRSPAMALIRNSPAQRTSDWVGTKRNSRSHYVLQQRLQSW